MSLVSGTEIRWGGQEADMDTKADASPKPECQRGTLLRVTTREATNDHHWMNAYRWAKIETALWGLFENLAHWQDAKKLRGELLIDHISVRYEATEKPHPASKNLLAGAELGSEDLSLDLQLQYMAVKDTAIVSMQTTKRKLATEAESKADRHSGQSSGNGKTKKKPTPVKKLKKKKPAVTSSLAKAPNEKSLRPTPAVVLEVEQNDGARLDALQRLDSMLAISKPPEVQILLLENMSEADVLATFERYSSDFDKLFEERTNKAQTHSYVNICHMDIMDILNADIRDKMMKQLAESYSTKSNHTSLIINGLLPLWIVLLFMDTYKLSHDEAARVTSQLGNRDAQELEQQDEYE
ncbi:uncharacterized protein CG4951-like [Drosophila kikkawai]|uniref:Uncharacterized protein CG4951-like n=1 Tax=Drosophila kikkawai TaxID=30033 RepID=A0ABM4GPM6_DROKI